LGYLLLNLFPSSDTGSLSGDVCASLFGSTSMMTLSGVDVWLCVGLSAAVIGFFVIFYHKIFAVTFDEGFATSSGIRVRFYNFLIAAVSGVVIVLAMKLVGALLISALIIFPALSAMRVFRSFRAVVLCSAVISVVGSLAGLLFALLLSTPTGASVAVVHILIFMAFTLIGKFRRA
jgi:zinc transport system permease protein